MANFSDWRRNGRLATVVLGIVFATWVAFQVFVAAQDRPPLLDQLLYSTSGFWLANIAIAQDKKPEANKKSDEDDEE